MNCPNCGREVNTQGKPAGALPDLCDYCKIVVTPFDITKTIRDYPEDFTFLRNREGDQPLPTEGGESVTDRVIERFEGRRQLGIQRYRRSLETFNGRDPLVDYLEEDYDRLQYFTQMLMERDASVEESARLLTKAYIEERARKSDPPTSAEITAYTVGVQDAAKRYFLARKVANNG